LLDGKQTTMRLIGVDTPETVHPQKPVEEYGKEASRFTENLLKGESVYVEYEPGPSRLDRHGRTLAYLYRAPDGLFVNLEIVRQGYGHAYIEHPFQYLDLFRHYETRAREAGKGLWGNAADGTGMPASLVPSPVQAQKPGEVAEPEQATVYITRTGTKYHRDGCRYLSRGKTAVTLEEAKRRGLGQCSVCRPPEQ